MTANELWTNTIIKYDYAHSEAAPGFDDTEASIILTYVQQLYANSLYNPKNNRNREGLEETEIRKQGLSALIKDGREATDPPSISSNQVGVLPYGVFWELPDDFWVAIMEYGITNIPNCQDPTLKTYNPIEILPITHDFYLDNRFNNYQKPYVDAGYEGVIWRLTHGKKNDKKIHELITDGTFKVTSYILRYLAKPSNIVVNFAYPSSQVNPVLDSFTHEALADLAVKVLRGIITGKQTMNDLNLDIIQ